MDNRRAKIISALIDHLENMDAEDLKGQMPKPEAEIDVAAIDPKKAADVEKSFKGALGGGTPKVAEGEKGPMEVLVAQKDGDNAMAEGQQSGDELSDDEFEEMLKLNS